MPASQPHTDETPKRPRPRPALTQRFRRAGDYLYEQARNRHLRDGLRVPL